ncbi:MAG: T9SS type A sorting domain-containing protein [Aureispira sp.]|nr:T9SS type A sorting domain-containing protein [Aureispira sp.]
MDTSKHNLRSSFLLLLLTVSSFSLFAQKNTTADKLTVKTNREQTGTTQIQPNIPTTNGRLILQSSTTGIHQTRQIPRGGSQYQAVTPYGDNIYTSDDGGSNSNTNQTSTLVNCPMMYVQVNVPFLQSCISSSAQINFCNNGTSTAFGAFVDVEFPTELSLDSADLSYTLLGPNLYRFQLGTVLISICNQFEVHFTTDCDPNLIGEEHCIQAHIYPDTLCNAVQNTPLITVDATCNAGKTIFTLSNHGTAVTMNQHMHLIIIDDHLIVGGSHTTYVDDTIEIESNGTYTHGFTAGQNDYKLTLTDGLGNQLLYSRVKNCSAGSSDLLIENFHTHQDVDQFGNGGILPSISEGCAINGDAPAQTNSIFTPSSNTSFNSNGGSNDNNNNSNNKDASSNLTSLELEETTVLIFPNPFSQYATVRIEGPISDRLMFRLYDATGKTVQMIEIENQREFQVERGNLLQGMYLYQIESEGKLIDAGKLIIK